MTPGAFRDSLQERGAGGVKLLFQHDPNEPIGVWLQLKEDAKGLFAKGRLMQEVAKAREVLSLMRAGALDGLSIGFRTVKGRSDPTTGIRRLEKIDLWEISVVTFPMLPEARVSAVKRRPFAGHLPSEQDFQRWLTQHAGLTRTHARTVIRSGYRALTGTVDMCAEGRSDSRLIGALRRAAALMKGSQKRLI